MKIVLAAERIPDAKLRSELKVPKKKLILQINNTIFKLMFNQALNRKECNDYLKDAVSLYKSLRLPKYFGPLYCTHLYVDLGVFQGMLVDFRLPLNCSVVLKALKARYHFALAM